MSVQVQSSEIELVLQHTTERIEIAIFDDQERSIDPTSLSLNIMDASNRLIISDTLYPSANATTYPARIQRFGKGKYYFPFGADTANGTPATFHGQNPPAAPYDISINNQLGLSVDNKTPLVITLTAAIPTQATPLEIVNSINNALIASPYYGATYCNVARYYLGQLFLTSPQKINPASSAITLNQTILNNAALTLFGIIPGVINIQGIQALGDPDVAALLANQTNRVGDWLFNWQVTAAKGLGSTSIIQVVKISSAKTFQILPYLRLELDKAIKEVNRDAARTGYTDAQLMAYLSLGVAEINAFQPITNLSLDTFPTRDFMMILIWTSLLVALVSQGLFSVDTDMDYSDRGANFRIDHASKIKPYVDMISSRLESRLFAFKLLYAPVGTVKVEAGANFRLAATLSAAPSGALLRGLYQNSVGY